MKNLFLLTITLVSFGLTKAQTIVTSDGYTMFRMNGTAVYDGKGNQVGSIDGGIAYDASRNTLGKINGNEITKQGNLIGRLEGNNKFNDNSGYLLARIEGTNILDSGGYTKARIQGNIPIKDLALLYYFFIKPKK